MIYMYEVMDKKDGNIYSLDDMINMHDNEPLNYSFVHKRIICPCCKKDVLDIFIDDEDAYIKSNRKNHFEDCDYFGFKVSQQEMKKRIKNKTGFLDLLDDNAKKKIPKKDLSRRFTEDDIEMYKLFYGEVSVKPAHSKDDSRYKNFSLKSKKGDSVVLTILNTKDNKDIIYYLVSNVDNYINLSIIGQLKKVDKYHNILLKHNSLFMKG